MGTIKLKRGTGSPAGSLEQYEVAMDVAAQKLYVSSNGTDAVILANKYDDSDAVTAIEDASSLDLSGKIETSSGLTNSTNNGNDIIFATFENDTAFVPMPALNIARNLGSDGAESGKDDRGGSVEFSIQSDATNTNNAPQNIYPGGIYGKSGSNDGADPHYIGAYTYDDGINSYTRETIWEATKDQMDIFPELRLDRRLSANDGIDIEDPDAELDDAVVNIKVDQSGYNRPQIMCEDSNQKVFSIIGETNTFQNRDKFIVTLDPDNLNSPTNQAAYAGDYGVYYLKEYSDIENPAMEMNVFGAKDAFKLRIYDDNNGASPNPGPLGYGGYGWKPFEAHCESFQVHAKDSDTSTEKVLEVDSVEAIFEVPIRNAQLSADPSNPENGWQYYNTTTHKLRLYANGAWVDLN